MKVISNLFCLKNNLDHKTIGNVSIYNVAMHQSIKCRLTFSEDFTQSSDRFFHRIKKYQNSACANTREDFGAFCQSDTCINTIFVCCFCQERVLWTLRLCYRAQGQICKDNNKFLFSVISIVIHYVQFIKNFNISVTYLVLCKTLSY